MHVYSKWGLSATDFKRQESSFCQQILCPQCFLFAFTFLLELWAFVTGGAGGGQGQDFDRPTTSQKIGPFWSGQNRRYLTKQVLNHALSGLASQGLPSWRQQKILVKLDKTQAGRIGMNTIPAISGPCVLVKTIKRCSKHHRVHWTFSLPELCEHESWCYILSKKEMKKTKERIKAPKEIHKPMKCDIEN